uniref:Uncharacterized protein n=1 Tax=Anguilla anguilla TaxID=7936 RepID=A0A0E9U239_ANGAN
MVNILSQGLAVYTIKAIKPRCSFNIHAADFTKNHTKPIANKKWAGLNQ